MKKHLAAAAFLLLASQAGAAHAGVNFNLHVGIPGAVVVAPAPPPLAITVRPDFIYSPFLGFYVSVGTPYDMVFMDGRYYRHYGEYWYWAPRVGGPWVAARHLPPGLARHRFAEIRRYRDREYRMYMRDRDHYRGRWHRPEGEWREHRGGEWRGDRRHDRD